MPTDEERRYYRMGFADGFLFKEAGGGRRGALLRVEDQIESMSCKTMRKPTRKLSAWNKFVKANSKKKIYQFASGKLKLKKMGIAFRKTPAGRKK